MTNIQIKDVPDAVHAVLKRRAGAAGQSLQEYMLAHLATVTSRPTIDELFDRIEQRTGGRVYDSVEALHEAREERDAHLQQVFESDHRK